MSGASPARRKREVEDKKGKARSVLEVAREIERKRRELEATREPNNETKPVRDGCSHGLRDVCAPWSEACKEIKSDCTPSRSLHPRYKLLLSGSCSVSRFSTANDERIEKMF